MYLSPRYSLETSSWKPQQENWNNSYQRRRIYEHGISTLSATIRDVSCGLSPRRSCGEEGLHTDRCTFEASPSPERRYGPELVNGRMTHRYSGWPGAWCLDCGQSDPFEEAMVCEMERAGCHVESYPGDSPTTLCPVHEAAVKVPCPEPGSNRHNPYVKQQ